MKFTLPRFPERKPREPEPPAATTALLQFWFFITVWAFALLGSLWMLVVFIVGAVGRFDWQTGFEATERGVNYRTSLLALDVHWSVAVGLFAFCAAIAIYNAVWLELRRHTAPGLMRNVLTGIGVAVALFMISGATVVQQRGTDMRARDDVIAAQTAMAGVEAVKAQIAAIDARLNAMRDKRVNNEYAATAANVGVEAYRAQYMNAEILAREDPARRRLIERALGAAMTAETLEAQKLDLAAQLAVATVGTVKAEARTVKAAGVMAGVTAILEDARKPVTAILGELLAMTVFSAALAAWASRRQAQATGAPMPVMIEDHSAEEKLAVDPEGLRKPEKRQRMWDDEKQAWVYERAKTFARYPTRKSGRKVPGKDGKTLVDDETEYEPGVQMPADQRARAETVDENRLEAVGLRQAGDGEASQNEYSDQSGGAIVVAEVQLAEADEANGAGDISTPGLDSLQRSSRMEMDQALASEVEAAEPPIVLTDDRVDELIEQGIVDPDTGEIRSQEHIDIIRQDDRAARYPALAKPETEAA